ncbi:guanine nucleotide-binding protein-like NSN1 [Vigna unguiculata]|uniref:guanine nucleotide-binding protein-like NSN1 n=1 Tax=Vigna unguiculata TaxID=3917 RepID=UPI00101712B4|nr:guanine nucleotide-binding protein-like NSN1 [Vigna unguiculata]
MVMKSKKSKSKRVSLKNKYKVRRKVKEHNRKKAKEAKKLRQSGKNKVEKDPGIPNNWPFKEQELKALEARRTKAIEELEQKKVERKERARKTKLGLLEEEDDSKFYGGARRIKESGQYPKPKSNYSSRKHIT